MSVNAKSQENNCQSEKVSKMSQDLLDRAEINRQKALALKKAKLIAHPYAKGENSDLIKGRLLKVQGQQVIDSGGGFLIEEDANLEEQMINISETPAPIISKLPTCKECQNEFNDSYLLQTFDYPVCDKCRDNEDKHSLITKTEAKQEYLLKDCDFDRREPPLKCIIRKNPHNALWGEMKLYLHLQVEERALMVWGSEENLLQEREKRNVKKQEVKIQKFNKKMKKLRMEVRSSLYNKVQKASHVHEFGEDTYNEDDDTYSHSCTTCNYEETYEKM